MASRDRLIIAALHGTAWRRATERGNIDDAVAELQEIAGGRRDLLAETAGVTVGAWLTDPATHIGTELLLSGLCLYAGADLAQVEGHLRVGWRRGRGSKRPIHGSPN